MTKHRVFFFVQVVTLASFAAALAGCGHSHHTERIIEREVPSSSTTVVR